MTGGTLVELLRQRADRNPEGHAFLGLGEGGEETCSLTFAELDRRSRLLASHLARSAPPGERVLLLLPDPIEFATAFYACLRAGLIAVPANAPAAPRLGRGLARMSAILADATPTQAVTTAGLQRLADELSAACPAQAPRHWTVLSEVLADAAGEPQEAAVEVGASHPALLQYTSGSTSSPKGVVVTHANLIANARSGAAALGLGGHSRGVSWLPLFHDMGLMCGVVAPLVIGFESVLLTPAAFFRNPESWLRAVTRYRATFSGGPNFAFELCVRKVGMEARRELDLSSWEIAFCGAEPIRKPTIDGFIAAFAPSGFWPEALRPLYGLAEATLMVTGQRTSARASAFAADRGGLERGAALAAGEGDDPAWIVDCGPPLPDHRVAIVDPAAGVECEPERIGEIWFSGPSVADGYWGRPEESESTFRARIAGNPDGRCWLRTGDLGFLHGGSLYVTGRLKDLLIVRGRNLYPQDVEITVGRAAPGLRPDGGAAFSVEAEGEEQVVIVQEMERQARREDLGPLCAAIRRAVAEEHAVDPYAVVLLRPASIPKTSSGKIQRSACRSAFLDGSLAVLAEWRRPAEGTVRRPALDARALAVEIRARLAARLGVPLETLDPREPFSRLGLDSAGTTAFAAELSDRLERSLPATLLYEAPTVELLARALAGDPNDADAGAAADVATGRPAPGEPIAVVGLACRFPGAESVAAFWRLLIDGTSAVGAAPPGRLGAGRPARRPAGYLADVEGFDAPLFGLAPREVEAMDPQQRLLLEVAWEALEDAGIAPEALAGTATGVFVGLASHDFSRLGDGAREDFSGTGRAASIAANRLSYFFDWRGPSLAVDTACSSSLVAVHLACRSLAEGESSVALAGGVNLLLAAETDEPFARAGLLSSQGACRAFDAAADGYVRGEGAGLVLLKPLSRALADGDRVRAVIRGSAVNQDGRSNGLTAPNPQAQAAVLRAACDRAGIAPGRIQYVEAHGSATPLGDPIEARALGAVIGAERPAGSPCAIGSVKTNLGHLEGAAGIAGLLKVVLALERGLVPPSLNYTAPNPRVPFAALGLEVQRRTAPWRQESGGPPVAGVSSFGFGGTNAHVILEATPAPEAPEPSRRTRHLVPLSARTERALDQLSHDLAGWLDRHPEAELADLCATLDAGRRRQDRRRAFVVGDAGELTAALRGERPELRLEGTARPGRRRVAFLFPGIGDQYPGLARCLYDAEPVFRRELEALCEPLAGLLGRDPRELLLAAAEPLTTNPFRGRPAAPAASAETALAQPALFAVELALARTLQAWGVQPDAVLGYSLGTYAAACVAGVFPIAAALRLVVERARLLAAVPAGAMLSVALGEAAVAPHLTPGLALAAVNTPDASVVSGPASTIAALQRRLSTAGVATVRLAANQAFHSPALAAIGDPLAELVRTAGPRAPALPLLSDHTGTWMTDAQATNPAAWVAHTVNPVRFGDCLGRLWEQDDWVLFELGPGGGLTSFAKQHPGFDSGRGHAALAVLPAAWERRSDEAALRLALARAWVAGVAVDPAAYHGRRRRLALPSYPFERRRHALPEGRGHATNTAPRPRELADLARLPDLADWFSVGGWRRTAPAVTPAGALPDCWQLAGGSEEIRSALAQALRDQGQEVELAGGSEAAPARRIVSLDLAAGRPADGFFTLLPLARDLAAREDPPVELTVVTRGLFDVLGGEPVHPELAPALGVVRGLPLEAPHVRCRLIDAGPPTADEACRWARELVAAGREPVVALRGPHRWIETWEPARLPAPARSRFREGGVYLITGGLGGLGLALAGYLARRFRARLGLLSRSGPAGRADAVRRLEEEGADFLILTADVADPRAVRGAVEALRSRYGRIHGVLHAAGVPGGGLLRHRTAEQAAAVLAPKVQGTLALAAAMAEKPEEPLDLFVLFSSLVAVTGGGPGQIDYAAANAFLDAFAQQQSALGRPVVSIAWGEWQWNAWEGGLASLPPAARTALIENRRRIGIQADEGAEALERVLAQGLTNVVVSPVALPDLLALSTAEAWARLLAGAPSEGDAPAAALHPRPALGTPYEPPAGPTEEALARIWGEILGIDGIGAGDSFFELGGNSLHSVQVASRARRIFRAELDTGLLFQRPVLRDLARWIDTATGPQGKASDAPPLVPVPRDRPLPLSFPQLRLWFLDRMEPGTPAYNIAHPVRIAGDLDPAAFAGAFADLADRHEVLRTTYRLDGDEPVQVIQPPRPLPASLCDLSALPPGRRDRELGRLAATELAVGFDLAADPMLRVRLVRLAPREHVALLTLHHIAGDGWSANVVLRDFAAFYTARRGGRPAALPALPVQYADFAHWQRRWLRGEPLETRLAAWRRLLGPAPPELRLPSDRQARGEASFAGERLVFALPAPEVLPLRRLAQGEGATLFMLLAAGLCALLARHSGQEDVVLGTEVANRNRLELEDLAGFFVNILPLRFDARGNPGFAALVARVREAVLAAFAVEDLPFEKIVEDLAPDRSLARVPLVRLMLVLQNTPKTTAAPAGLALTPLELAANRTSKFDLLLSVEEAADGGLRGSWHFRTDLFDLSTVERLTARLRALLACAAERPQTPLRQLDMTTPSERKSTVMEPTRRDSKVKSFLDVRPKAISVSQQSLVHSRPLVEDGKLPLLVEPAAGALDLASWARGNREWIERRLHEHGAILFRGFGVDSAEGFESFAASLVPELFGEYGDLPADDAGKKVYSSTPYPPDKAILFHNESSQLHSWPLKQFFLCQVPAAGGGATPLADCRRLYQRLDPALRSRFEELGVTYVRNFIPGVDVDWQRFFRTSDPAAVEDHCRRAGMTCEWLDGGESLRVATRCRAVAHHPRTGEAVFFNQIQAHHISCLDPATRDSLRSLFPAERLPRNVYYGDGSPIPDEEMEAVRAVCDEAAVRFDWQRGDCVLVDNMLTAHARDPFTGQRKILVAMGEMVSDTDLDSFGLPSAPAPVSTAVLA